MMTSLPLIAIAELLSGTSHTVETPGPKAAQMALTQMASGAEPVYAEMILPTQQDNRSAVVIVLANKQQSTSYKFTHNSTSKSFSGSIRSGGAQPTSNRVFPRVKPFLRAMSGSGSVDIYDDCGEEYVVHSDQAVELDVGLWQQEVASYPGERSLRQLQLELREQLSKGADIDFVEVDGSIVSIGLTRVGSYQFRYHQAGRDARFKKLRTSSPKYAGRFDSSALLLDALSTRGDLLSLTYHSAQVHFEFSAGEPLVFSSDEVGIDVPSCGC